MGAIIELILHAAIEFIRFDVRSRWGIAVKCSIIALVLLGMGWLFASIPSVVFATIFGALAIAFASGAFGK